MTSRQYDILLHILTRHTNLNVPYSDYVNGLTFPEQNADLLNTEVELKYRNYYIYDKELLSVPSSGRPSDDVPYFAPVPGPDDIDQDDIYTGTFKVLRADNAEPYRLIAVDPEYKFILVNSSKPTDSGYEFNDLISIYPVQHNEYIGIGVYDMYAGKLDRLQGVTLRVDMGEPCYSVIMEFLGTTGKVRFTLGDEHYSVLYDYYDVNGDRDYNGKDSTDYDDPVDVNGYYADHSSLTDVKDVNGGYADNWAKMYTNDVVMKDEEIYEFRKSLLEGIIVDG